MYNAPLRGGKGTLYEGGVRVPLIVSWPGNLPAGTAYADPVSSLDVFATALAAAGKTPSPDKNPDGRDLVPYLNGTVKTAPHERLFWRTGGGQAHAIRDGQWKLIRLQNQSPQLYDLTSDIAESTDLASAQPAVVQRLTATLDAWDRELIPPAFPGSSVKNEDWGPGGANQASREKRKTSPPAPPPDKP